MKVNPRWRLWYNFSWLGMVQAANFLLSLIVIPYTIRIAGVDGFGIISVAQVLIFYLAVLVDLGFNQLASREVALNRNDRENLSRIFSLVITSKIVMAFFAFALFLLLILLVPFFYRHFLLYIMAFSFVIGQALLCNWLYQGLEKMKINAVTSLVSKLFFVCAVFIFLKQKEDLPLYLFFMGLGNILAGILGILVALTRMKLQFIMPARSRVIGEIKAGWHITVSNLSMTTIQYSGVFVLRLFTNDRVVGLYSIAEKIYMALKVMIDVFAQAAYPGICLAVREGRQEVKKMMKNVYLPFVAFVATIAFLIMYFAADIIHFFVRDPDPQTFLLLQWLALAVLMVAMNIPFAQLLLAREQKKEYMRIFSVGMIVNIGSNFLLAPVFSAMGTVTAILITEGLILAGLYIQQFRSSNNGSS